MADVTIFIENHQILIIYLLLSLVLVIIPVILLFSKNNLIKLLSLSAFSSLVCVFYLTLDSPDVALTESSIGACLTTVIIAIFLTKIKDEQESNMSISKLFFTILAIVGAISFLVTIDRLLPDFGNSLSPANSGVARYYVENTEGQIGIKSIVAAILASYRGFDTLGETLVILSAGASVMLIFGIKNEKKQ